MAPNSGGPTPTKKSRAATTTEAYSVNPEGLGRQLIERVAVRAAQTDTPQAVACLVGKWLGNLDPDRRAPKYGSADWLALPHTSRLRLAAILRAAESWRRHISPEQVASDLIEEMARVDDELRRRVREASWAISQAKDWGSLGPTYAELRALREYR